MDGNRRKMKAAKSIETCIMHRNREKRSSASQRRRNVVSLLVALAFLSAFLFSTLHFATLRTPHADEHCSFCIYYNYSYAENISDGVLCIHVPVVESCPFPLFTRNEFHSILSHDPRAPPLS